MSEGKNLQNELILLLQREKASYVYPVNSLNIGRKLRVSPSYVRTQMGFLKEAKLVAVRRGNGGGYYLIGGQENGNS